MIASTPLLHRFRKTRFDISTFPRRLLTTVIALTILVPSVILTQVKIKEKVEIKPKAPAQTKLLDSGHDFFSPPLFVTDFTRLTLPGTLTISGTVTSATEIGVNQSATLVYVKYKSGSYEQDHDVCWIGRTSNGSFYGGQNPFTGTFGNNLPFPGPNSSIELYTFDGGGWSTGVRELEEYDDSLRYNFTAYLWQGSLPAVLVNATAKVTGSFLPGVKFDHWEAPLYAMTIQCGGSTEIPITPSDSNNDYYSPNGMSHNEAIIVVRLDGAGDYAYLRSAEHEGHEITTTLADGCSSVFDATRGGFPGESHDVQVTVTGGGKSATMTYTLVCEQLDHFKVLANPRMLAPGRSAALRAIPQDMNNQEIPPPGNYDVTFNVNSNDVWWPRWWGAPPLGGFAVDGGDVQLSTITVPADVARSGRLSYVVDSAILETFTLDSLRVEITAVKADDWSKSGVVEVKVKRTECVAVSVNPDTLAPGGTANLTLGTSGQYPTDQAYDAVIVGGGANPGTLVSPSGSGTELIGTMGPVQYVAPATIDSTIRIQIAALAYGRGGSYPEAAQAGVLSLSKKLSSVAATQSLSKKAREARMLETGKMLADNTCSVTEVVVERVEDKCPEGFECSSPELIKPTITVVPKKSGEIPGATVDCAPKPPKNLLPLAKFETLTGDEPGGVFEYATNSSIGVCCDERSNKWVLKYVPPLNLFGLLDYCDDNLNSMHAHRIEANVDFRLWNKPDKCTALRDFERAAKNLSMRDGAYVIMEMLDTHEQVHMADYQEDVKSAVAEIYDDPKYSAFLSVSIKEGENWTADSAKQYFQDKMGKGESGLSRLILSEAQGKFDARANKTYYDKEGKVLEDGYELTTQTDLRVQEVVRKYIAKLGVKDDDCRNY